MEIAETKVVFENNDLLILDKPSGLPTVPLKNKGGASLLKEALLYCPLIENVVGQQPWEKGTLHRLDTLTSGLVIFTKNQEAYDFYSCEQNEGRIIKTYRLIVSKDKYINPTFEPFPFLLEDGLIKSRFRSYGKGRKEVRPVYKKDNYDSPKWYSTKIERESDTVFLATITEGFRHQIRAHMAWSGYPLIGDELYKGVPSSEFGLRAIRIIMKDRKGRGALDLAVS